MNKCIICYALTFTLALAECNRTSTTHKQQKAKYPNGTYVAIPRNVTELFVNDTYSSNATQEDDSMTEYFTLEQICEVLSVPKKDCNCITFPDICAEQVIDKKIYRNLTCLSLSNTIDGSVKIMASVLGIIGNGLVIIFCIKLRKNLSEFKKIILYLAMSDLTFSTLQLVEGIPKLSTCKWVYSNFMCKILRGFNNVSAVIALGFIVMIAVERYYGIVKTLQRSLIKRRFYVVVLGNITLGILVSVPIIAYSSVNDIQMCVEKWTYKNGSLIYSSFLLTGTFLFPVIVISFIYCKCIKKMTARVKNRLITNDTNKAATLRTNKKMMRLVIIVMIAFVLLVGPNRIAWILYDTVDITKLDEKTVTFLKYFATYPYMFHVSINPLVYSIVDPNFRKQLLQNCFRRKNLQSRSNSSTRGTFLQHVQLSSFYSSRKTHNSNSSSIREISFRDKDYVKRDFHLKFLRNFMHNITHF